MAAALTGTFQIVLFDSHILLIFTLYIFHETVLNGPILYKQSNLSCKTFKCGNRYIILFILVYLKVRISRILAGTFQHEHRADRHKFRLWRPDLAYNCTG